MEFRLDTKALRKELEKIEDQCSSVTVQNANLRYPDQPNVTVRSVLGYLEQKRGVLSKAPEKAPQHQIDTLAQAFVDMTIDPSPYARKIIERESASIVTDPIHNREYGHNHPNVVAKKGFDWYGVDTRLLIRNIKGKYYRGKP